MWTQICGSLNMQKYPLSLMRQTLLEWKYQKQYANELKSHDIHEKITGELEIQLMNKIQIVNKGGSVSLNIEPVKFFTTKSLMASFDEELENQRLKDFLSDFDTSVYIKARDAESNTTHRTNFFER